jgi:hypothetical protein
MMRLTLLTTVSISLAGCGMNPPSVADRVPVKGRVTLADGKPVRDVMLSLQPLDGGFMAGMNVGADGTFRGEAVPGKYAYFLGVQEVGTTADRQKSAVALKGIPGQYRSPHLERTLEVQPGGSSLQLKLN